MKTALTSLLATLLLVAAPLAAAADEPAGYRLTTAILDRLDAVNAEARGLGLDSAEEEEDEDEEDADGDIDVDAIVRRIERDPRRRALLARHGLTAREFALAGQALLHAGTFLAFEKAMEKQGAERLLAGYTATQRANIELLRQRLALTK